MNSTDQDFSTHMYTLSDFKDHINSLTENFGSIDDVMLNQVDNTQAEYNLEVYYSKPVLPTNSSVVSGAMIYPISNISEGITKPFDMKNITSIKKFIQSIESMNLNANNIFTTAQLVENQVLCYNWTISLQYQFLAMSHIYVLLDANPTYCQGDTTTNNS
mmetsp:Transcript_20923/g.18258  ORF Transcript_20923/g.18258 Transcript_20923/m.18258 type:complete len:160 (-) Transcript_20923:1053-1532(-)